MTAVVTAVEEAAAAPPTVVEFEPMLQRATSPECSEPGVSPGQLTTFTVSPAASASGFAFQIPRRGDGCQEEVEAQTHISDNSEWDLAAFVAAGGAAFEEALVKLVCGIVGATNQQRRGVLAAQDANPTAPTPESVTAVPFYAEHVRSLIGAGLSSNAALVVAVLLLERLKLAAPNTVQPAGARRYFATCALVAAKLVDDTPPAVAAFATAIKAPVSVLAKAERCFLQRLDFELWVDVADFRRMAARVQTVAVGHLLLLPHATADRSP